MRYRGVLYCAAEEARFLLFRTYVGRKEGKRCLSCHLLGPKADERWRRRQKLLQYAVGIKTRYMKMLERQRPNDFRASGGGVSCIFRWCHCRSREALASSPAKTFFTALLQTQSEESQRLKIPLFSSASYRNFISLLMASRSFNRGLRTSVPRQLVTPIIPRRSIVSASKYARANLAARTQPAVSPSLQQIRGLKQIDFAGTKETVYGSFLSC